MKDTRPVFLPKTICINCKLEKPCSFHGTKNGYACADCWSIPIQRNVEKKKPLTKDAVSRKKRVVEVCHPDIIGSPIVSKRPIPPTHPDAL
jgi:hypothetical protein